MNQSIGTNLATEAALEAAFAPVYEQLRAALADPLEAIASLVATSLVEDSGADDLEGLPPEIEASAPGALTRDVVEAAWDRWWGEKLSPDANRRLRAHHDIHAAVMDGLDEAAATIADQIDGRVRAVVRRLDRDGLRAMDSESVPSNVVDLIGWLSARPAPGGAS